VLETRDSGFLAPRRRGMTVEIIGARDPMTVCHLVCRGCFPSSLLSPSFRDTRFRVDPETRDSGFLSSRRPGMTVEIIGAREPMTVCHLVCRLLLEKKKSRTGVCAPTQLRGSFG